MGAVIPNARFARVAGAFYLAYFVVTILADRLARIGMGTPGEVLLAMDKTPGAFSGGLVLAFVSALLFLLAAWALHSLLKAVNPEVAVLFLVLNAVGAAVHVASALPLVAATRLEGEAALVAIAVYKTGFVSAQLFYGTWVIPLGYLMVKSGLFPRALGVLVMLDGPCILVWFLQEFLMPDRRALSYPGAALSFVAELSLALWLLFRGAAYRHRSRPVSSAAGR